MRAYLAVKYHEDYRNKETVEVISAVLSKNGYETTCVVSDIGRGDTKYNPKELMQLTFEKIDLCDLVIIDLTEKGVGLGIEAGYAYAKGIPIVTIARQGSDISETLEGISTKVLIYNDIKELELLDWDSVTGSHQVTSNIIANKKD